MIAHVLKMLSQRRLSVFLFHKIPQIADPLVHQDLDMTTFNRTLDFIAERFNVLPLDEAMTALKANKVAANSACITFDDGYRGWIDRVIPSLEERGAHATFFITTGQFEGRPMWHERINQVVANYPFETLFVAGLGLPALPVVSIEQRKKAVVFLESHLKYMSLSLREAFLLQLESLAKVKPEDIPVMSVDELRLIHNRGFAIGAHTINHPILSMGSLSEAETEIAGSREILQGMIGGPVTGFAYPNGRPGIDFGLEHVKMVERAGYTFAVTTHWGAAGNRVSPFEVPRFTPWGPSKGDMTVQMIRNLVTKNDIFPKKIAIGKVNPIKVLSVENGAGFGGAVVALKTLLSQLQPDTCESHVVLNIRVGDFSGLPAVKSTKVIPDRIYNFRPLASAMAQSLSAMVAKPLLFGLGRIDDIVNRFPYLIQLLYHAWKIKPDIIHGNNEPSANREAMFVAKLLRKPFVQHVRGDLGVSRAQPWLLSHPNAFIPVSRWLAGDLLISGVSIERIRQIYDAVDFSPINSLAGSIGLRTELDIAANTKIVAMIGMFVPWKGQDLFIQAVKKLESEKLESDVIYLLIGDIPERGDPNFRKLLQDQVDRLNIKDSVVFTGKRNDMPLILPEIDVVVSASLEPEPLGLVMLEAMYNRCVFIGPAHGAATELVHPGKNGYLFKPGDVGSLAQCISDAVALDERGNDLKDQGRSDVMQSFSREQCATKTLAIFKDEIRRSKI